MGTTPVYDLPYPDGSDLVIEGDDAMQALAARIETLLTPAYALSLASTSPTQSSVTTATVATFGPIAAGTSQFDLEADVTIRYTGPTRWFLCDFQLQTVVAAVALASSAAHLVHNGSTTLASTGLATGSGTGGTLRITTPVLLNSNDALQLGIEGAGGSGAVFSDKQFRIASIGAPAS